MMLGIKLIRFTCNLHGITTQSSLRCLSTYRQVCVVSVTGLQNGENQPRKLLSQQKLPSQQHQARSVGFFNKSKGDELWDGVLGVSNAGRKGGRAKGKRRRMNLNRGQRLGTGQANILWPGLNTPIIKGPDNLKMQQLEPNPDYKMDLVKLREGMGRRLDNRQVSPLARGWQGCNQEGRSIGPPDPIEDYEFEGFDSRVLQVRFVQSMTGTLGRQYKQSVLVAVGNGNGLAGFGLGKATNGRTAMRLAKNRAAQNLMYIPRYEDHTVYHNMFVQQHKSKIFIRKKEKGYGLVCHRLLKTICELAGIKDLHCKVDGNTTNYHAITRGFFEALSQQETFDALADRTKLHVVEKRPERAFYPNVLSSPAEGKTREDPLKVAHQDPDLEWLYFDDKKQYVKPPRNPFYHKSNSYKHKVKWYHKIRNQPRCQVLRYAGLW